MLKTFLQENQVIGQSYQHYGGLAGFQDYGIIGCQIKNRLLNIWRDFFLGVDIHEVELPSIMPHAVLKASGHVDRFTDYVVYDHSGCCHRADHLAKKWFQDNKMDEMASQVDSWDQETLELNINKYGMLDFVDDAGHRAQINIRVQRKNLMIEVPSNALMAAAAASDATEDFLRPELAQGIFVNFKMYQSYFQQEAGDFKPFGIAQIGKSYRKEISPQPFSRLREFSQAEIEYFVDPLCKNHTDYDRYSRTVVPLLTSNMQENGTENVITISIADAISQNLISHKLMGYFLAKIYLFAERIGLRNNKIRFRQHQKNEMAHYASQCWDLECQANGSWLECIGCADRGCYDLSAHSKAGKEFNAKRKLPTPQTSTQIAIKPVLSKMGHLGKNLSEVKAYFYNLDQESAQRIANLIRTGEKFYLEVNGTPSMFESSMFEVKENTITITHESFIPHVLEPSFGIDRLMYALLEQNIWYREKDERRAVLSLPDEMAVYDVAVFPLHKKEEMVKTANHIREMLCDSKFRCYTDDSNTAIGKRYVRCDEIGVRKVVTVDPGTLQTGEVTIRDRDTMEQITVHMDGIAFYLKKN